MMKKTHLILFYLFLTMHGAFAGSCEEHFNTDIEKNLIDLVDGLNQGSNEQAECSDPTQFSISPHSHKRGPGKKYHGATPESFRKEAVKKQNEFNDFFSEQYPKVKAKEAFIDFWAKKVIRNPNEFSHALQSAGHLEERGYPLDGFIFIIDSNGDIRIAPRTMKGGVDLGLAKHIALTHGSDVAGSGEFTVKSGKIYFNLKSGTYMKGLKKPHQFLVCRRVAELLKSLSGDLEVEFNEDF